jgi:hypothetical protein
MQIHAVEFGIVSLNYACVKYRFTQMCYSGFIELRGVDNSEQCGMFVMPVKRFIKQ